ncbi:TetR family transcriptional regulator [Promicromonospora thailandica]|uniref:Transcriptional regulator, TetR family n=1 Tax=Promicromonospora thailandica TaxID=765201 RepID=A0A9X2G9J5_9MICO|nr:TetR family transcriptional regulator [Promicromonospora thailandica]MCP2265659.1 transcriptional regulator, TetR family [Promicromonospora thailandica]BFF21665.1 TetR/AcrR family transcriptional regulator [Promicromonospora thailandica]
MARWDPGAQERLTTAALDLYLEHGYENVTVADIAERAGLTRRSFFRYFPDKREVLFAGSERLPAVLREAVLGADPAAPPLAAVLDACDRLGTQLTEALGHDHVARRRAVIDSSAELQERERTKSAAVSAALDEALRERGTDPATATLVAQVASVAIGQAFRRWSESADASFTDGLHAVLDTLRAALADGDGRPPRA